MTNFEKVKEFMNTFGQEVKNNPEFPNEKIIELRKNLIDEEFNELKKAINDNDIVERMSGRRMHLESGRVYHIKFNPPKNKDLDDITNEKLVIRKDDQPGTVKKRLSIYHKTTKPLIDYYSKKNIVIKIDGNQSIQSINQQIIKNIPCTN